MDEKKLQLALIDLQSSTFGLFRHHLSNIIEMVVDKDNELLTTIHIGELGGLTTTHILSSEGKLVLFDKGDTLFSLLSNPEKLIQYYNDIKVTSI